MRWNPPTPSTRPRRVARRMIVQMVVFSSVITLCLSVLQLAFEYRSLRQALEQQLDSAGLFAPNIAGSVWDYDEKQIHRALGALILLPHVVEARVEASTPNPAWQVGHASQAHEIVRRYPLRHEARDEVHDIGTLVVVASLTGIYRQVATSAASIVLSNALKTLLVVLFMVYLIRRLITSRLEKMAVKLGSLMPGMDALREVVDLAPQPIPPTLDELDAVDWTLDHMAADLRQAVNALTRLNEDLEQRVRERTAELESFSYSVSHDLRTPLRAIDGFSRILLEDHNAQLDAEGQRLLQVVRTNTARMGQLIDDMLAFSRMGRREMRLEAIDMQALTHSVFESLRSSWGTREVHLQLGALPPAWGDTGMVRQVLENLLTNAIKFTQPQPVAKIEISAQKQSEGTVYCVHDNGVGFDMKYADKLFNVFERLHSREEFEGTGIGLAIVKRVVTRHGGKVWVHSEPGGGTAVYFTLPPPEGRHADDTPE